MDATEVFSKITYLEEGMKKLLAQKAASSEEIQQLLAAVEAKENPTIKFDTEALAKHLTPMLAAKMPALDAAAVAKQLGPVLVAELPTPATLQQAGGELLAKVNSEYKRLDQQVRSFLAAISARLDTMEQRVDSTVNRLPTTVGLDAFHDKRLLLLVLGMPAICLITLIVYSSFFRVSKAQYEQLQAQSTLLQEQRDRMTDASMFYSRQINDYKRKFPKAAGGYFRDYHPALAAQSVELATQ
jgi:Fe2+ transport system protein B